VASSGPAGGPYRPTLLALREGLLLEQAVRALPITPRCWWSTPPVATIPTAPARLLVGGEVVGCWVRTRAGARPVAVHVAWPTDAQAAVQVVLAATRRARTPEPLRRARALARTKRARSR
jgi:deoxyribonuclease V